MRSMAAGQVAMRAVIQTMTAMPQPIGASASTAKCSGISARAARPQGMIHKAVSGTAMRLAGIQ
jgi:hypothetical protein